MKESLRLINEFKNEDKIEKSKENPNEISFCEDLTITFDNPKNNNHPQQQLNRTYLSTEPNFNINDSISFIKNNMNKSCIKYINN